MAEEVKFTTRAQVNVEEVDKCVVTVTAAFGLGRDDVAAELAEAFPDASPDAAEAARWAAEWARGWDRRFGSGS